MHDLTKRINKAIKEAKKRDGYLCVLCKQEGVVGAHMLPRRSPFPWYHADDPKWIITLCRKHHREYDENHKPIDKISWLRRYGLYDQAHLIEDGMEGRLHEA